MSILRSKMIFIYASSLDHFVFFNFSFVNWKYDLSGCILLPSTEAYWNVSIHFLFENMMETNLLFTKFSLWLNFFVLLIPLTLQSTNSCFFNYSDLFWRFIRRSLLSFWFIPLFFKFKFTIKLKSCFSSFWMFCSKMSLI